LFRKDLERDGTTIFRAIVPTADQFEPPPGVYGVDSDSTGWYLIPEEVRREPYIPVGAHYAALDTALARFFDAATERRVQAFGLQNRYGVLMYGPPGTGKTSAALAAAMAYANKYDAIVLTAEETYTLDKAIGYIRANNKRRPVIVVWDEFEHVIGGDRASVVEWLDGSGNHDRVFVIAITNYIERLPQRITDRPSRFGLVVHVGLPTIADRVTYLLGKFGSARVTDSRLNTLRLIARLTSDVSMDHTIDIGTQHFVHGIPVVQAVLAMRHNACATMNGEND
jgi:hypothetical protein